jgi:hypothetical protein
VRDKPRFAYLLPAVAMMLGWGLRGFIGGGPFGAMIPGAMVALTLCVLYRRRDAAMLAAFAAVGVGIGGEMTYGQTVGFIVKADTFWWGLLGLTLKGAIWGALAGAVIGMGFTPRPMLVLGGGVVMALAAWTGWKLINEPKVIYFSNLLDKPRVEIWAGFLLAAIALVGYLAWQGRMQPALRFAIAGFIGGGIGFGGGGAIQGLGRIFTPELNLHWWKYMEFFFGFCFGWALAWAWAHSVLPDEDVAAERVPFLGLELAGAGVLTAALLWLSWNLPVRFGYLLGGGAVLYLLSNYRWAAKHVACTVTFTAVALDLARYWSREYQRGPAEPAYALAVVASLIFGWFVIRWAPDTRASLEVLMWACVVDATAKFAIHPKGIVSVVDHICIAFILMAAAVSWMLRSTVDSSGCESVSSLPSSASVASAPSL